MKGKKGCDAGGRTPAPTGKVGFGGGNKDVVAELKKKGGKVQSMAGAKAKHRLDRPGRKMGGRVGADKSPLSSAHKGSSGYSD